ncbi:EpsG family [Burkholderiaceae bacterium]
MLAYWLLFAVSAWRADYRLPYGVTATTNWPNWWLLIFGLLVLMIGLRHEVGGDWGNYVQQIYEASFDTFQESVIKKDPAYSILNWLSARFYLSPHYINAVCAVLFSWGLIVFCRVQPLPWLALTVAIPYLVTVVAMGYTRQGVAIGLIMIGLVALTEQKILRFMVFVALAALFHRSAIILIPFAILAGTQNRLLTVLWVSGSGLVLHFLLLQESVDSLYENYIVAQYDSSGAAIRITMNAVPAMLFLLFRQRFAMPKKERTFWTWMSLSALMLIGLLVVSPSSTAVDRVALYWIPLQLFVLSRLPDAMTRNPKRNIIWIRLVIFYSAAVLFVWLFFATHASSWLPYQFYPWVLFWQ